MRKKETTKGLEGHELANLNVRIPRSLYQRLRLSCVEHDTLLGDFIIKSLDNALDRVEGAASDSDVADEASRPASRRPAAASAD